MTKDTALRLLGEYCAIIEDRWESAESAFARLALVDTEGMAERFPKDGSEAKAMRWLGYAQGVLVATGLYSLGEVKEHSRRGWVRSPTESVANAGTVRFEVELIPRLVKTRLVVEARSLDEAESIALAQMSKTEGIEWHHHSSCTIDDEEEE